MSVIKDAVDAGYQQAVRHMRDAAEGLVPFCEGRYSTLEIIHKLCDMLPTGGPEKRGVR
jgi:hypothetical protein